MLAGWAWLLLLKAEGNAKESQQIGGRVWVGRTGPSGRGIGRAEAGPWGAAYEACGNLLASPAGWETSSGLHYPAGRGAQASGLGGCVGEGELRETPVGGVRTAGGAGRRHPWVWLVHLKGSWAIHCMGDSLHVQVRSQNRLVATG